MTLRPLAALGAALVLFIAGAATGLAGARLTGAPTPAPTATAAAAATVTATPPTSRPATPANPAAVAGAYEALVWSDPRQHAIYPYPGPFVAVGTVVEAYDTTLTLQLRGSTIVARSERPLTECFTQRGHEDAQAISCPTVLEPGTLVSVFLYATRGALYQRADRSYVSLSLIVHPTGSPTGP